MADNKNNKKSLPKNKKLGKAGRKADKLTRHMIRAERRDLRDQRREVNRSSNHQIAQAQAQHQRAQGDLRHIAGETKDFIGAQNRKSSSMFEQQRALQEQATNALRSNLSRQYTDSANSAMGELQRLGIQQSANLGQLNADASFADSMAQISGQNSLSNMDMMSANSASLGAMLSGMAQGSYQSHMGKQQNTLNDAIAAINSTRNEELTKVRQARKDLSKKRPEMFFQLLQSLKR